MVVEITPILIVGFEFAQCSRFESTEVLVQQRVIPFREYGEHQSCRTVIRFKPGVEEQVLMEFGQIDP